MEKETTLFIVIFPIRQVEQMFALIALLSLMTWVGCHLGPEKWLADFKRLGKFSSAKNKSHFFSVFFLKEGVQRTIEVLGLAFEEIFEKKSDTRVWADLAHELRCQQPSLLLKKTFWKVIKSFYFRDFWEGKNVYEGR